VSRNSAFLFLSIVAAFGADKNPARLTVQTAEDLPYRLRIGGVVIAAHPVIDEEDVRLAFGKLNPNRYRVLPVLVAVTNTSPRTVRLEKMKVEYSPLGARPIESIPPQEVPYLHGPDKPKVKMNPLPIPSSKKNPLAVWEIEGRAFAAKMLPPGESASGFFYFQADHRTQATVFVNGLREAASGEELFYFEIPIPESPGRISSKP